MLILLPPSEGKTAPRRGKPMDPLALSYPALAPARAEVADAVAAVSGRDDALDLLGVGASLRAEVDRNRSLLSTPSAAAGHVYSGVLYDALDLAGMSPAARRRANRWLVIVSALYGAVRPVDRIAAYRLSMGTSLPGLGPLATWWRPHLAGVLGEAAGRGLIVDCRSSTYAAAWTPPQDLTARWVQVAVPGASHMAKHTRGLVTRHLCEEGVDTRRPQQLAEVVARAFAVSLAEPASARKPWVLSVHGQR